MSSRRLRSIAVSMPDALVAPMLSGGCGSSRASGLRLRADRHVAFFAAVPIMQLLGMHLDQHQARRVDALLEPALQPLGPMLLELALVADELGPALDRNEDPGTAEQMVLAVIRQPDIRVPLDLADAVRVVAGEEEIVAVILDLTVVRHRPRRDRAGLGLGGQHAEVGVAHRFAG